jgi:CRISPR-associated protein Csd1
VILQALRRYAEDAGLVEGMDVKERLVHLVLTILPDGSIADAAPWRVQTRSVVDKKGATKEEIGRPTLMPEFPGVNAGGKAYFLADACDKVLGLESKTGAPIGDDGSNADKAFKHFWQRIADAYETTKNSDLKALLAFRDRYLVTEESRRSLSIVGVDAFGKEGRPTFCARTTNGPIPLAGRNITFQVGARSNLLFHDDSPLRDYWKETFNRERFADAPSSGSSGAKLGVCLVTGDENQPIAEVHRTLIKGIRGLPPIGGYVVSFDASTTSLCSYGFERGWNAPVSEQAAAAYALGLNAILGNENCRRSFGGAVLCSWVRSEPDVTASINHIFDAPSPNDVEKFFKAFALEGRFHNALETGWFHSLTLAANGGRVVVRRWLDVPLRDVVEKLELWFEALAVDDIRPPKKLAKGKGKTAVKEINDVDPTSTRLLPFSIYALAVTTARVPSEVQTTVYDNLYTAALEGQNPQSLLVPVLHRLRIAAAESGNGIRFHTSRFAMIKLILNRSDKPTMTIERHLCDTEDKPYNCGRLLALLDDLQYAAQGRVGADIVARFYGNASTFPRNVFQRLLRLAKHHRAKLLKSGAKKQGAGKAIGKRIDDVLALFSPERPDGPPDFPGQLTPQEQGRFALGFHQQKAANERAFQEALARLREGAPPTDESAAAEVLAEASDAEADVD